MWYWVQREGNNLGDYVTVVWQMLFWAGARRPVTDRQIGMVTLENVRNLIERLSPTPICDDCVAERLALNAGQHASRHARELAGSAGFERRRDICSLCSTEKLVTRCFKSAR
jgi:hypothetical protein